MRSSAKVVELHQASFSGKMPEKPRNKDVRTREYLTPDEVERLMKAAGKVGRHGFRDKTLILVGYRHGFRVSELVALQWEQINLVQGLLHVVRLKGGVDSTHPIRGPEIRALKRLQREYEQSPYVFTSERRGPLTTSAVRKIIGRAGENADIEFPIHPHMLRHTYLSRLYNVEHDLRFVQDQAGHASPTTTAIYAKTNSRARKRQVEALGTE